MKFCYHMHIPMLFLNFHAALICEEYRSLATRPNFLEKTNTKTQSDPNLCQHSCLLPFFVFKYRPPIYINSMPICLLCMDNNGDAENLKYI